MASVLQWNTRSVHSRSSDILYLIGRYNPSVVALSETWLAPGARFRISGFNILRDDRDDGYGGTALLIKKNCLFSSLQLPTFNNSNFNAVAARIGNISYLSVYISRKDINIIPILKKVIETLPPPIIVLGDFNAHHSLWGAPNDDAIGILLVELMDALNLCVINDGSPTRCFVPGQNPSYIDLSFCSSSLSSLLSWKCLSMSHGSDHYPIILTLPNHVIKSVQSLPPLLKFKLTNCDWDLFSNALAHKIQQFPGVSRVNLDYSYNNLISSLIMTAEEHFEIKNDARGKISSPPWWDKECTEIIKKRNKTEKDCNTYLDLNTFIKFRNATAATKRLLKNKKREGWRNFCASLSPDTPISIVWKKLKRYRGSCNNIDLTSFSTAWVEPFFNKLAPDYVPFLSQMPYVYNTPSPDNNTVNLNSHFSLAELKLVLKRLSDSAPGVDGIPYSFYTHLNQDTLKYILDIINVVIDTGNIPESWKEQIIIPILKPHKDSSDPISYRPVALSVTICKIAEHLIKNRLEWYIEKNRIFPNSQFGFRKGRSTMDSLYSFSSDVLISFSNNESVVAAFLDITAAYDNVNLLLLKQKMLSINIPSKFVDFLFNLYTGRTISVRVPGVNLPSRLIWRGVPQGSVLSPLLYNIYTHDLDHSVIPMCSILQYADDLVIYNINNSASLAANSVQKSLNELTKWLTNHDLSISADKSVVVTFSRRKPNSNINMSIGNSDIPNSNEVRFLGVKLDSKMSGLAHANHVVNKCEKSVNLLRSLAGVWWGAHPSSLKLVYNAIIRSILDYGTGLCPLSKQIQHKLNLIQSKSLRIIAGAMKSTPINALQVECGDPPLHLRRQYLCDRFFFKITQYEFHPLHTKVMALHNLIEIGNSAYWRNKSVPQIVIAYRKFINLTCNAVKVSCHPLFEYDYEVLTFSPTVHLNIGISKVTTFPEAKLNKFIEDNGSNAEIFFTDASKALNQDQSCVGATFLQKSSGYFRLFKYPYLYSIFSGEGMAILECLNYILDKKITKALIFSDSLSFLQSVLSNPFDKNNFSFLSLTVKHKIKLCADLNISIVLAWIPGHRGIQGNESADQLAGLATTNGSANFCNIYNHDLLNVAKVSLIDSWNQEWSDPNQRKGRFFFNFHPVASMKPWFSKLKLNKRTTSIITRLRLGHCSSPAHLSRLKIRDSPLCDCGMEDGDIEHILLNCSLYQNPSLYDILVTNKAPLPFNLSSILSLTHKKYILSLSKFISFHNLKL